jgi:excisionase family DNA binding protein
MTTKPRAPEQFLTIEELADELAVQVRTVREWRVKGHGPKAHKIGRFLRYRRSEVEAWLRECEISQEVS